MADARLDVDPRIVTGKKVKGLRREGLVPAHLYGRGTESLALQASQQNVMTLLRDSGPNAIIDLHINGEDEARPVVLRGVQRDPVSGDLVHVDFFQISLTERLRTDVPLVLAGEAPAVSVYGGVLLQSLDHLSIEAMPRDVPQNVQVDVSGLEELDAALFVRDLVVPASIQVLSDLDQVVVKVAAPKLAIEIEEEEAAAAAAAALEEGEEAVEEGEEGEEAASDEEEAEEEE